MDNDDIFLNNDIFDTITKISENGNFDIVEFKAISNRILKNDIFLLLLILLFFIVVFKNRKPNKFLIILLTFVLDILLPVPIK